MPSRVCRTTVYWTDDHYQLLRELGHRHHMTMSELLRQLIDRVADGEIVINNTGNYRLPKEAI